MTQPTVAFREAPPDVLERWDDLTVRAPGGHVLQSKAWAEHRATRGWQPRYLAGEDGSAVLALLRPWPLVGGASAYLPRGPVPTGGLDDEVARLDGATRWLAAQGVDVVASDAEVVADGYRQRLASIGFQPIEEIQPSRHRLSIRLDAHADEDAVLELASKSTRQRIRQAERGGLSVVRHDAAPPPARRGMSPSASDLEFADPVDKPAVALERFHGLASATADRRHFALGSRDSFLDWTTRAYASGFLVLLEAVDEAGRSIAGLLLYRHGGRLSTALSGDRAEARKEHPGAFHLLRWRAIQAAIREGATEMDLGGVDVAGARHEPREGEPMFGLYQHKRGFGAEWLELPGAHERVLRPWRYAAGRLAARVLRGRA
ncbi:MAG TPA: peptidoglycan bridge formation glycyltransferase FemA/FemB family protein [Candidatus Limnocylindrales bacterium]|nr:peptidoglycan bridge formation glycyltransferase FemA/FemB family protein [Candidatus Limnocylindrales bacterium]